MTRCMAALVAMTGRVEEALELTEKSSRVLDELGMGTLSREASAEALELPGTSQARSASTSSSGRASRAVAPDGWTLGRCTQPKSSA